MALSVKNHLDILPKGVSSGLPSFACLLGNMLEAAGSAFSYPESFDMV